MKLDLVAEPIGALGGMGGHGGVNLLGAPRDTLLEVVVREAVQNSWDARTGKGPVKFHVEAYSLSRGQRQALATAIGEGLEQEPAVLDLPGARDELDAIVISDRGTCGLGGAAAADAGDDKDGDFARFVFSIGETKPEEGEISAGGTYGFGRSSFLGASTSRTIIIHTVCFPSGGRTGPKESRLIAMNWGERYRLKGTRRSFTGRHWFGKAHRDGVLPVTGQAADDLARAIGMPLPQAGETGTTILILQPRWSMSDGDDEADGEFDFDQAREHARTRITQALLWYVWPRIHDGTLLPSVRWFGSEVSIPAPSAHPRLKLFLRALELAQQARTPGLLEAATEIDCARPIQGLGHLGLVKRAQVRGREGDHLEPAEPVHHVALMRDTRLVVQYLRCPPAPDGFEYAGAFITDRAVDRIFAASEPPTHDCWAKTRLRERSHKVFVNVALKRIAGEARTFADPGAAEADGSATGLGPISDALGSILAEMTGPSTTVRGRGGRTGGGRSTEGGGRGGRPTTGPRVELGVPERQDDHGRCLLRIPFSVQGGVAPASLEARAAVVIEGGSTEGEPPEGDPSPEVLGWEVAGSSSRRRGSILKVPAEESIEGTLVVAQPQDCTVRIAIDTVR